MNVFGNPYLFFSGCAALIGGLLHIGIIAGGPSWYRFFGAPEGFVMMAAAGHWYPVFVCLVVATLLFACAAYAFSGAGLLRRLPCLPAALVLIGGVLTLRGVVFFPLMILAPATMATITSSTEIDAFLIVTSILCLATGLAYLAGYARLSAGKR